MRSSIACDKCRKSKTKCENSGPNTVCRACAHSKRECVYGPSAGSSSGGPQRRESAAAEGDNPPRKRKKLLAPTLSTAPRPREGLGTCEDALDSPLLTPQVWEELFEIYEKHFAVDFPFLHKRTFLSSVQQRHQVSTSDVKTKFPSWMPHPYYPPLLLAFLTQTARFHGKLVEQIDSKDPIATANFYAQATRIHMGTDFPGMPTLEKVQALLMLGYHEWTALQGTKGWVKIGTAIRCAQGLGYQWDADQDDDPQAVMTQGYYRLTEKDQFIVREIQRRTFWSCCLMDRYLSWGKNRTQMLRVAEMQHVQLPCNDDSFFFGRKIRTRLLGEDDVAYKKRRAELRESAKRFADERNRTNQAFHRLSNRFDDMKWEPEDQRGELSWYIQIVDHFGEISKWSCARGRRQEGNIPPWDERTTFKKLDDRLQCLKAGLPAQLQLTPENTQDRIYKRSETEYMALAPWLLPYPKGPIDDPLITEKPPHPEYWMNQAKACFGACREFADLLHSVHSSRSHNKLVETPTVAFAAYTVAWSTIYCHYFPNMDMDSALSIRQQPRADDITRGFLVRMSERFKMANDWTHKLAEVQRFFREERAKYKKVGGEVGGSPLSSTSDGGGGLKDYALHFETSHKSFGDHLKNDDSQSDDKDFDMADTRLSRDDGSEERTEPTSVLPLKTEKVEYSTSMSAQSTPVSGGFTPVNNPNTPGRLNPVNDTRALPNGEVPTHGPQAFNRPSSVDSSFTSHNPQYFSPTSGCQSNVALHSQHDVSAAQNTHRPSYGQGHVSGAGTAQEDARIQEWSQQPVLDPATKAEMERLGGRSISNDVTYGVLVQGDGFLFDPVYGYPVNMAFSNDYNTNANTSDNNQVDWYPTTYESSDYSFQPS